MFVDEFASWSVVFCVIVVFSRRFAVGADGFWLRWAPDNRGQQRVFISSFRRACVVGFRRAGVTYVELAMPREVAPLPWAAWRLRCARRRRAWVSAAARARVSRGVCGVENKTLNQLRLAVRGRVEREPREGLSSIVLCTRK